MNKKVFSFLFIFFFAIIINSCKNKAINMQTGDPSEIKNNFLEINVNIGSDYFLKKYVIMKSNHTPQTVIWLEDNEGNFIDTIFITRLGAKGTWKKDDVKRPSCFPVWSHRRGIETMPGYFMPTRKQPAADSVTAATPTADFIIKWKLPENFKKGSYRLNLEINTSYDYNKTFNNKDKNSSTYHLFDGQPSLIWSASVEINDKMNSNVLTLAGHGDLNGDNGTINDDMTKITTAKKMLKSVSVKYFP